MGAMTVQQVIDMLGEIEDKSMEVHVELDSWSIREINGCSAENGRIVL